MSKNNTQKAARQRRRSRQKHLVEAGRQAEDLVSTYKLQATEAVARAGRLEAEAAKARQDFGDVSNQASEAARSLRANTTILEGLRGELELAAQVVDSTRAERDDLSQSLERARKELVEARAADSDARSLRDRLRKKSEEIDELKAQLREAKDAHRRVTAGYVVDRTKKPNDVVEGATGRGVIDMPNSSPGSSSE